MLNGLEEIDGLTPEQIVAINKKAEGLINKKTELETKLKTAKTGNETSAAELERLRILEQNLEQSKLEEKESYQEALLLKEKGYKSELEKLTSGIGEKDALIHKLVVENGLSAELVKYGVHSDLMPLIQQGLSAQAQVVEGQAMIGEQSLSDHMKEWAETPAGKASRVAPGNSNGNGNGGDNNPANKKMSEMTEIERTQLFHSDKAKFDALKAEMVN